MVSDEIQLLSRKFEFLNAKLQEQDQTFNQIKGDLRRPYSENQGYHHIQGGVSETMKNQAAEISTIRAENGRAIQTLSDMLGGLKCQIEGIQTLIFTRGSD